MKITIIGVEPPCPRCRRLYDLTVEALRELGIHADLKKIVFNSDEAQRLGRTGTAHDIAQWADIEIDWDIVQRLAGTGWSKDLDTILMPCKKRADAEGWLMTPVLRIDEQVVCMGYVPDKDYIKENIIKSMQEGTQ